MARDAARLAVFGPVHRGRRPVRTMFAVLLVLIVGGLVFWLASGSMVNEAVPVENGLSLSSATSCWRRGRAVVRGPAAHQRRPVEHGGTPYRGSTTSSRRLRRAVIENWQSEFLQFSLFILATIWLVQKGSNESKQLDDGRARVEAEQRIGTYAPENAPRWAKLETGDAGLRELARCSTMTHDLLRYVARAVAQQLARVQRRAARARAGDRSWGATSLNADFWERTLQNWQSEFLAVGTMAVFTIYLRQRGSPESKPVGAPHDETASSG